MHNQTNQTSDKDKFLSPKEVAELLRTTPKTIYTYLCRSGVKCGKIRKRFPQDLYVKLGRKVLFIKPRLIEWLLSGANMDIIDKKGGFNNEI